MQLDRLLRDATGTTATASARQQHILLSAKLNERHGAGSITPKGVAKWFERGTVPGPWLMKIAALPASPLNLAEYA